MIALLAVKVTGPDVKSRIFLQYSKTKENRFTVPLLTLCSVTWTYMKMKFLNNKNTAYKIMIQSLQFWLTYKSWLWNTAKTNHLKHSLYHDSSLIDYGDQKGLKRIKINANTRWMFCTELFCPGVPLGNSVFVRFP